MFSKNELIHRFDSFFNGLEFAKSKLQFPDVFPIQETQDEISQLTADLAQHKAQLESFTDIEQKRGYMFSQLHAYTEFLRVPRPFSFSRSQGMYSHTFYVAPLINIRDILFYDTHGGVGVSLSLTNDPKDAVHDKEDFISALENAKRQILESVNLYDLYKVFRNLSGTLKNDFYPQ